MNPNRLPEHERALELFTEQHFDVDTARILARSELEHQEQTKKPLGRLVGAERNG